MNRFRLIWMAGLIVSGSVSHGERINQEGRILGAEPVVTSPMLFNTPEAYAILSAMQVCPLTSSWNEDISQRPVLANSDAMIAQINADLSSSRRTLRAFQEMNFVLVPDNQPLVPIDFLDYPDESDPSPYPIPTNMPIETWPAGTGGLTLEQWQQDINGTGGDRHSIVVQPGSGLIWETWQAKRVGTNWQASNGAKFDLKSNAQRPAGWTSGDAAGLPMFPALVRYDECERGMVEHACRLVVYRTRRHYLYPANHYASSTAATQTNVPAMGQRLRLKSSFVIPPTWSKQEKAILFGLKKYGAIVADNGGFFSISVTPDHRWPANAFSHLSSIGITNFEVIQATGPAEGPRSPNPPSASAGPDRSISLGGSCKLEGGASFTGARPSIQWTQYSGPGTARFADAALTNTTVSFTVPGVYTLMMSVDDSVHAVARDAVVITVKEAQVLAARVQRSGTNLTVNWSGGSPPYTLESSDRIPTTSWRPILSTNSQSAIIPLSFSNSFFRVRGQ